MFNSFSVRRVKNGYEISINRRDDYDDYVFESMPRLKKALKEVLDSWDKEKVTPRELDNSVPF